MDLELFEGLLVVPSPASVAAFIERHYERMDVGIGSVALHVLARAATSMPPDKRRYLMSGPWFGGLIQQLGAQLSRARETDARGMMAIIWALARLGLTDIPEGTAQLAGKRVLMLASLGHVTPGQLVLTVQSLAKLKLLRSQLGADCCIFITQRLHEYHTGQVLASASAP